MNHPPEPPDTDNDARLEKVLEARRAPNTVKAYQSAAARFTSWWEAADLDPGDRTVARYVAKLAEEGKAPPTIRQAVAAIRADARDLGEDDPCGPLTRDAVSGAVRLNAGRGRGQVSPLRRRDVAVAAKLAARSGTNTGLRDGAVLWLGSDCLLRVGELAAVRVEDLVRGSDGSGRLTVPRSKTDQEGKGETLYVTKVAMAAVTAWQEAAGVDSGPLFRRLKRDGSVFDDRPLSVVSIRRIIQRRAKAAGFKGRFSGHSLRVGSALSLARRGAEVPELLQAGRWKGVATATRYIAQELASRGAVAQVFEEESE